MLLLQRNQAECCICNEQEDVHFKTDEQHSSIIYFLLRTNIVILVECHFLQFHVLKDNFSFFLFRFFFVIDVAGPGPVVVKSLFPILSIAIECTIHNIRGAPARPTKQFELFIVALLNCIINPCAAIAFDGNGSDSSILV